MSFLYTCMPTVLLKITDTIIIHNFELGIPCKVEKTMHVFLYIQIKIFPNDLKFPDPNNPIQIW